MDIKRVSRKAFIKKGGTPSGRAVVVPEEDFTVYVPGRVSTSTRLHELFHTTAKEEGRSWESNEDWALEELSAEDFSARKRGKDLTSGYFDVVIHGLWERGMTIKGAARVMEKALKKMGYSITSDYREYLRDYVKKSYESWES